jgi:dihydropteroate synthase type 2
VGSRTIPATARIESRSVLKTNDSISGLEFEFPESRIGLFGILNLTRDSFSDGGRFLDPERAIEHALALVDSGANAIDVGAASSHPDAETVSHAVEWERLLPVISALRERDIPVSIDSRNLETQRASLAFGVQYLNDVDGFRRPELYPDLAAASCGLIAMYRASDAPGGGSGKAGSTVRAVCEFFDRRIDELVRAGIARERIVADPGMGLFLGDEPEPSFEVLASLDVIREHVGLPVLVSVSRKSFLGAATGREVSDRGAATLAAELFAADRGADHIRTHDPRALRDALRVQAALAGATRG